MKLKTTINHTPGPWFVGSQNDYPFVIDRKPSASGTDFNNHGADVAVIAKPFPARGVSEMDNAKLIASAPEMFEEIKALKKLLRNGILLFGDLASRECGNSEGTPCDDRNPNYVCKHHAWIKLARMLAAL